MGGTGIEKEDGNRSSFRNVVFLLPKTPEDEKIQKTHTSVYYTPLSEPYKIYLCNFEFY
jgi:hypothetical protein